VGCSFGWKGAGRKPAFPENGRPAVGRPTRRSSIAERRNLRRSWPPPPW
jgi:hypothetical protein